MSYMDDNRIMVIGDNRALAVEWLKRNRPDLEVIEYSAREPVEPPPPPTYWGLPIKREHPTSPRQRGGR